LIALAIVAAVAFAHGLVTGLVVTGLVFLYHQFEVYYLRPIIYGRMIQLSPLAVLVAAVLGIALAGPLGAIAAIPIGGAIQLILVEVLDALADARTAIRRRVIVDGRSGEAQRSVTSFSPQEAPPAHRGTGAHLGSAVSRSGAWLSAPPRARGAIGSGLNCAGCRSVTTADRSVSNPFLNAA